MTYISREAVLRDWPLCDEPGDAYQFIRNFPAADVRPVVFCGDCKHKGWVQEPEHGKSVDYCRLIERCVDKQFFCAAGERKTNCWADMREES